jgi:hypothetical protein
MMGSTKKVQSISATAIVTATTYTGGESPSFNVGSNDITTLVFDVNAGSGTSAIVLKIQEMNGDSESDFYKSGDSGFEVDEISIPLTASTNNQRFAIRLDTRAMNDIRTVAKTVGGTGQINTIEAIRDGSTTPTPPS